MHARRRLPRAIDLGHPRHPPPRRPPPAGGPGRSPPGPAWPAHSKPNISLSGYTIRATLPVTATRAEWRQGRGRGAGPAEQPALPAGVGALRDASGALGPRARAVAASPRSTGRPVAMSGKQLVTSSTAA